MGRGRVRRGRAVDTPIPPAERAQRSDPQCPGKLGRNPATTHDPCRHPATTRTANFSVHSVHCLYSRLRHALCYNVVKYTVKIVHSVGRLC